MFLFGHKPQLVIPLALVTALQMGCGLGPDGGQPPVEIAVHQQEGEVFFEFFFEDRFLGLLRHRIRVGVSDLSVNHPKGERIWYIRFSKPGVVAQEIKYGVLPEGFRQVIPREINAPRLKSGAEYQVDVSWGVIPGRTNFIYQGTKAP